MFKLTGSVTGLRVGLLKEGFEDCESDVADIVRTAAMSLTQLGISVKEISSDYHKLGKTIQQTMMGFESAKPCSARMDGDLPVIWFSLITKSI